MKLTGFGVRFQLRSERREVWSPGEVWENVSAASRATEPIEEIVGKPRSSSKRSGVGRYLDGAKRNGAAPRYMAARGKVFGAARSAA